MKRIFNICYPLLFITFFCFTCFADEETRDLTPGSYPSKYSKVTVTVETKNTKWGFRCVCDVLGKCADGTYATVSCKGSFDDVYASIDSIRSSSPGSGLTGIAYSKVIQELTKRGVTELTNTWAFDNSESYQAGLKTHTGHPSQSLLAGMMTHSAYQLNKLGFYLSKVEEAFEGTKAIFIKKGECSPWPPQKDECTPSEIPTKNNYSASTIQPAQGTPSGTGSGRGRGYLRGFGNVISPGDLAERLLGLWDGTGEVIDHVRNNRAQFTQLFSTSALLARYYALSAGKAAISYAPAAGVAAGAGAAAVAPAAISFANLEYSQSQVNAAKANGGYTYIPGPVQTSGPNSIWVFGRVYVGPKGQLYQATSWGFSPVYNTYSDYWSGTQATLKR